jgi:hypothetical protein
MFKVRYRDESKRRCTVRIPQVGGRKRNICSDFVPIFSGGFATVYLPDFGSRGFSVTRS